MWAVRRASIQLKNRGLSSGTARSFCVKSDIATCYVENCNAGIFKSEGKVLNALVYSRRYYNKSSFSKSYTEVRPFSSQAGAKSSGEQDVASPELEMDDELVSDSELYEGENELEGLGIETDVGEKKVLKTNARSEMTKAILAAPKLPLSQVLDKWFEEGNEVTLIEVSKTMFYLRKRRMFVKALQLSEWLKSTEHLEFTERSYASHVDLISKVLGTFKAEEYIQQIPESFRGQLVYSSILANCVLARDIKKSEEVFNKIKNSFPLTCFPCDQMLLLYKRTNRKKIGDVLLLMEKENIKPSVFTYQTLIDVKGQSNDISGMEQIIELMKSNGVKLTTYIQTSLARYFAAAGLKDKAEAVLKEMEGDDITETRWVCQFLLPIYASIGREDEVSRIWKVCESEPRFSESLAAIEAWGQLKKIEVAEAIFEKALKTLKKPSRKHYTVMLNVYTSHNMLDKGKALVERMAESHVTDFPGVCDALVKLHARSGELEKAEAIIEKAHKQKKGKKLLVTSYLTILNQYAQRGDVHNAEKIFFKMRQVGIPVRIPSYRLLIHAYINAKAPAYGFHERLEGDNVIPDKLLLSLLARVDAFGKPVDEMAA